MSLPKIRYSRLKHLHFVDKENHDMGTLEDLVLDKETLELSHILLGSSFFEEFMEEIGEIDNIDELAPVDIITGIEDGYVVISCNLEDLQTTNSDGTLPIDGLLFTKMMKLPVNFKDSSDVAELYDFIIDDDNPRFIFLLTSLIEKLLPMGYGQQFSISVPLSLVSVSKDKVDLNLTLAKIEKLISKKYQMKQRGRDLIIWEN